MCIVNPCVKCGNKPYKFNLSDYNIWCGGCGNTNKILCDTIDGAVKEWNSDNPSIAVMRKKKINSILGNER